MAIEIVRFHEYTKGSLRGFLTLRLTGVGIEIRDMTLHEKDGETWISPPAKPYEKDGETKYANIVDFYDKNMSERFQKSAREALDVFRGKDGGHGSY